jgi:hypothetical protein
MKLIIQRDESTFYAYVETKKHHKTVEADRNEEYTLLDNDILDKDCVLERVMPKNSYFIFDLTK